MRVKTSITLPEELITAIDTFTALYPTRSEFIEIAIRTFIAELRRQQQSARDLEILNRHAERLNREASDVLEYQETT